MPRPIRHRPQNRTIALFACLLVVLPLLRHLSGAPTSIKARTQQQSQGSAAKLHSIAQQHAGLKSNDRPLHLQSCNGLAVAAAYYEALSVNKTRFIQVRMATAFKGHPDYTPFAEGSTKCMMNGQIGSFLKTEKHYSHCSIPLGGPLRPREPHKAWSFAGSLNLTVLANETVPVCTLTLQRHQKQSPRPHRHAVSALTTVQNSDTYFREWINYLFCTGWSHVYVYDDASDGPMKALLHDLELSGFITYVDWSHSHAHPGRQFMAMQDFLLRFRHETDVIAQMDDDCYYVAVNDNGQLIPDVGAHVALHFKEHDADNLCQIRAGSFWFGHGGVRERTKPLALSSFMRSNTSLSDGTIAWKASSTAEERALDSTLSLARTDHIRGASGMTHRWDMDSCKTKPMTPSTSLYFHHYKVKPWLEKKLQTKKSGSWGLYNQDEAFWESTVGPLHRVRDTTMERLDGMLGLSSALSSPSFPPSCKAIS